MRTRNFTYIAKNADLEKIQSIECQYHIYGHYNDTDIGGYIRFSTTKTITAAEKCIGYEVSIIEQDKINDKIQNIIQSGQIWEKGEKLKRGRRYPSNVKVEESLVEENKKIQLQLLELLQYVKEMGSLPISASKITNYVLHLNTNMKKAKTFEDLILLFVFTSENVVFYEKNGFINTIVEIFLRIISTYTIENRPIHTSDENRYNIYLHTKEGWIKETPNDSPIFDRLLRLFTHKFHQQMVREYQDTPINSPLFEQQLKHIEIFSQATTHDAERNKMKIIKNIFKHLTIQ
jgi:hypothetical protein